MTFDKDCDNYAIGVAEGNFGKEVAKTVKRLRQH